MFPYPISFLSSSAAEAFSTKSLNFDGVDDYVDLGSFTLNTDAAWSISLWTNLDDFSYLYPEVFVLKTDEATGFTCFMGGASSYTGINFGSNANFTKFKTTGDISGDLVGAWVNIILTYNGSGKTTSSNYTIYVDGALVANTTTGIFAATPNLSKIGVGQGAYFDGKIDELAIFNSELSAVNAAAIYNSGTPNDLTSLSPVAWYRMGENSTFSSPQILMPENTNKDKVSNYSMDFDGVNDYIQVSNSTDLDFGTGDFTWSLWVNYKTFGNYDGLLFTGATNSQYRLKFQTSGQILFLQNADGDSQVADLGTNITGTGWHHLCLIRSSGTITTFLDGSAVDTDVRAGNVNSGGNDLIIGDNGASFFTGNIDEVSMFNSAKAIGDIWDGTGQPTDLTGESGLVGYWRMGEEAIFNSTNWLLPNKAQDVYSRYSLDFDGTDDYVNCGAYSGLNSATAMTASVWFNSSVYSSLGRLLEIGKHVRITQASDTASNTEGRFQYVLRGNYGNAFKTLGGTSASGVGNLCDGNWHHLCFVWDDSTTTAIVYEDGVAVITDTSTTGTLNSATETYYIGAENTTPTRPITGKIDEAAIWNIALSPANVAAIYNSGKPTDLTSLSPITWHRMGEDATFSTNWTIPDKAGSNTGTSANMTNDDLTGDAPGVTANGVSANMTIEDRTGDAPDSSNNALSYNMVEADIEEEAP